MDTSGESLLSIVCDLLLIAVFVQVGIRMLPAGRPFPWLALVGVVVIGVPSLLQFALTGITDALARDPDATLAHGQWWRILTALLVQDGGPVAAVFNLIVVALVLTFGAWIWGTWITLGLFLVPSVVLNTFAVAWGRPGGGSSFAADGLMLSVCALGLVIGTREARAPSPGSTTVVRVLAVVAVAIGVVLAIAGDAHGVAMLLGFLLGLAASWGRITMRPRTPAP